MKTIIVGGGGGGLASALLASMRGEDVTLFEAHENLGGCASWFDRRDFNFDVGATTLSGVAFNEPLGRLFNLLHNRPRLKQIDPGMVIHLSSGKAIHYYSDFEKWMDELERNFPHGNHRRFWSLVRSINNRGWGLLESMSAFPFDSASDFLSVLKTPRFFTLYPFLFVSTELILKRYSLNQPEYLELINGILLISAQAEAESLPFLVGAMGLAYPSSTFAPVGGMKGFMTFLESECERKGVKIQKNSPVKKIQEKMVSVNNQLIEADKIILNITAWDAPKLFEKQEKASLLEEKSLKREAWGAFTLYFGCETQFENVYQQVHLNHPLVKNYFISFSLPDDTQRAPKGWQAVTISTHVEAYSWFILNQAEYKIHKEKIQRIILDDFKQRFGVSDLKYLTSGTPRTFEHYTGRKSGFVGGLPFLYGMNPWKILGHETPLKNIYRVGDTTFPGQGLVGVVAGALALDEEFKREL